MGDAPLGTATAVESASERFRFARDGDAGADGRAGGLRMPLAAAIATHGGDNLEMRVCNALASLSSRRARACAFAAEAAHHGGLRRRGRW